LKILIPILGFSKSGGYRVLSNFANEFVKDGHEVDFLVNENSDVPYFPTIANIAYVNIFGELKKHNEEIKKSESYFKSFLSILLGCYRSKKKYDVVIANHSLTIIPVYLSTIRAKKVYYIQAYEPEYYELMAGTKNKIFYYLSRLSYKFPFLKIVNSSIYCNYKEIVTPYIVYPGLDFSLYNGVNRKKKSEKILTVGTIARAESQKGTSYIIDAFLALQKKYENIEFIIAFPSNTDTKNLKYVSINPNGDSNIAMFYKSLDVYISAGIVQFGAVHYPVIESMACGTFTITTPYYPANDSNSYIIDSKSVSSIVKAIEKILHQEFEWDKRTEKASDDVKEFSWAYQYQNLLRIIESN